MNWSLALLLVFGVSAPAWSDETPAPGAGDAPQVPQEQVAPVQNSEQPTQMEQAPPSAEAAPQPQAQVEQAAPTPEPQAPAPQEPGQP